MRFTSEGDTAAGVFRACRSPLEPVGRPWSPFGRPWKVLFSSGGSSSGGSTNVSTSSCGPKPGVKATGSPIALGVINTKQPGTDFTDQPNMEQAYFDCVNANGGVNGHVIKLIGLTDRINEPRHQ